MKRVKIYLYVIALNLKSTENVLCTWFSEKVDCLVPRWAHSVRIPTNG